ncbi:myosin heavy chain, skeletal muscle, adult-like [Coregonus clupeaformis]|uniref:myosin heavy chain, skeletal muscle, adult-like n=1 Tax=Coregonus clupeaformis TaxID=59861 RepID=UPI001E1C3487|nr:myosin heavy chain, skeletal muscle, adult-like [Coregonus clupeaformis]
MKGVVALLALLFCLSGAWAQGGSGGLRENDITQQGHSTGREGIVREVQIERRGTEAMGMMDDRTPTEVDLLTDVKELRDMVYKLGTIVVEQREKLRNTEARVAASEDQVMDLRVEQRITVKEVEKLEKDKTALEARLTASESQVEALKKENGAQSAELSTMGARLTASESQVEALKKENAAQSAELSTMGARLTASESQVEALKKENAAQSAELSTMGARLTASESQVEALKKENAAQSAELSTMGPRLTASESQVEELKKENAGNSFILTRRMN